MTRPASGLYLRFRRMVDRENLNSQPWTLWVAAAPIVAMALLQMKFEGLAIEVGWIAAILLSAAWIAFVAWRSVRQFKAANIRSDRAYDQRGKYILPPDYATTESATKIRRRRKNG